MFCKYCGKDIDSDTVYCPSCGKNQTYVNSDSAQRSTPESKIDNEIAQKRPSLGVNFISALKNYYLNFAHFNGRTVRSEFLWSVLYEFIFSILTRFLLFNDERRFLTFWDIFTCDEISVIYIICCFINIVPSISLRVRRLHDTGKSGWFYLLNLIPFVGIIILMVLLLKDSSFSDNIWGLSPYNTTREYDETKTWRCEKCGCRTPNSSLTCKTCGETKPSKNTYAQPTAYQQKSTRCVCGELFYGETCPNCGRTKKDGLR